VAPNHAIQTNSLERISSSNDYYAERFAKQSELGGPHIMVGRNNIKTNLRLRLAGWKKAVKSPNTPAWLKKSIRKNIRDLSNRLRGRK
jgi:hypothetical protein